MKLEEASMNFDRDGVRPFLERLTALVEEGFGEEETAQVEDLVDALEVDDEADLEFPIRYRGRQTVLRVSVFMDDIDAPDVAFFTDPELAGEIDGLLQEFAREMGW